MKLPGALIAIATFLCSCFVVARGYPYPDSEVSAQYHRKAPERGCVEVPHKVGGSFFRVYACDYEKEESCVMPIAVDKCTEAVLWHEPNTKLIINVRGRDHIVRFYNQPGSSCYLSLLPTCCESASKGDAERQEMDKCRSLKLPTGEVLYDPVGCEKESNEGATEVTSVKENLVAALMKWMFQ